MNGLKNISINKKNNILLKGLAGAAVLFLFIFVLNFFNAQIKNSFYFLSYPVQKVFFAAGETASGYLKPVFNVGNLAKENENLKRENEKLLFQISLLQAIEKGNRALIDMSLQSQNRDFTTVMAEIYGLDGKDALSINKGSADGILEGMPVINQQGVLFGKTFEVYKNFSKVVLISNKNSVISVKVQQSAADLSALEIDGVVKGNGGLEVYLDLVPVDEQINEGDVLVTSVLEGVFPKDLLVGKITKKEKNDQKPFQQAHVEPFFSLDNINNLFVITNYKQEK